MPVTMGSCLGYRKSAPEQAVLEGPGSIYEPYVTWSIIKYVSCPMGQNEEMSPIHLCDE